MNKIIYENLRKELEIIKTKILNTDIKKTNLQSSRTNKQLLVEMLRGSYAELIVLEKLKELQKQKNDFDIISYSDLRVDDNKHPDIFDFLLIPKNINKKYLIVELRKLLPKKETKYIYKNHTKIFNLLKKYNIKTVEVKSSNKIEDENKQPYICYAKSKNERYSYKNRKSSTYILTKEELESNSVKINFLTYLQRIYEIKKETLPFDFEKEREKYYEYNFVFMKDIHFNVLWKKKEMEKLSKDIPDEELKKIELENLVKYLPEEVQLKGFTTKEMLTQKKSSIGTLYGQTGEAIFHLNNFEEINLSFNQFKTELNFSIDYLNSYKYPLIIRKKDGGTLKFHFNETTKMFENITYINEKDYIKSELKISPEQIEKMEKLKSKSECIVDVYYYDSKKNKRIKAKRRLNIIEIGKNVKEIENSYRKL